MKSEIKILSVEKKKNNYLITTDDKEFEADEETIIKYYIFKDKVFTKTEFNKILEEIEINKYFNKSLKFLSYKSRSVSEIIQYLKDVNNKDIIIERLIKLGYLNDEIYSKNMFEYCLRNNKGPVYLKNKLLEKGISTELISKTIYMYDYQSEKEVIENIVNKLANRESSKPVKALKLSILSKLHRDGFNLDIASLVISKVNFIDNSDELLKKDYQKQIQKLQDKDIDAYTKKQKIITYLLNKGYDYKKIKDIVE